MAGIFTKEKTINRVVLLDVDDILPNTAQPRQSFQEEDLAGLAASIRENGVLQPITVRKNPGREYELVSGERRLRAAKEAGLRQIPAVVIDTTARQSAIYAILENIQRQEPVRL